MVDYLREGGGHPFCKVVGKVGQVPNSCRYPAISPTSATQRQNSRNLLIFGSRSQKVGTTNASLISVVTPARRFLAAVVRAGCV